MCHTGPVTGSLLLFNPIYVICQWQCRDTKWTAVVIFNSTGLELHTVILEVVSNLMGENGMFEVNFYAESCSIILHFGKKYFIYLFMQTLVFLATSIVIPTDLRLNSKFSKER